MSVQTPKPAAGLTTFKLSEPLDQFPPEVFHHADTLEHLDLSGTGLSALPDDFGRRLTKLKRAFFSDCRFAVFPPVLASCPSLEMVAFRNNGMTDVPEDSLPPRLRWLILTNNQIASLPRGLGRCTHLQKCMLAGNQLRDLPDEMASCRKLGLLRLSANRIQRLPDWLFEMPELAFLSFAGNPCCVPAANAAAANSACSPPSSGLAEVRWADLETQEVLGQGASGIISKGLWNAMDESREVAIKLFKGDVTSDGTPLDEMRACITAGSHASLIDPLGQILDHPDGLQGIIMQLIPPSYAVLGQPPSFASCTRDCFSYESQSQLATRQGLRILHSVASAARHLHGRGVCHGDLYAHNILFSHHDRGGHALLGDFGAASVYERGTVYDNCERLDALAFAHLIEDVWGLVKKPALDESDLGIAMQLASLHRQCSNPIGTERPTFSQICQQLPEMSEMTTA
ncbi:outer arm dynein light chain 1 [Xylariomycetidae sp. FL2044]|nr:outer arm dynein light chain 1 [Xylariomycetidae sp. FL2044]KAH9885636.1 outer arm dynein light chain 1 [Xylariomycetidae sp. FL2044]